MKNKKKTKKKKASLFKDEKGQFTYVLLFVMIFVVLLILFSMVIPILQALTVGFWGATSNAITPTITNQIALINDTNTRNDLNAAFQAQNDMQVTTEQLFTTLVTYSGIITIVVIFFAWLLIGRRNVEAGGLG